MSELIISDELGAELERATGPVELRAKSGRKLGNFVPETTEAEPFCPWDPTLTREEAERIANEAEGYSLDEILRELERR